MFDVSHKPDSLRRATALALVRLRSKHTLDLIKEGNSPKGNAIEAARIAGILAAKKTPELIPHCHPIPLDYVNVDISFVDKENDYCIRIISEVKSIWKTGVEMESLTAASIAALTVYDMIKPLEDSAMIERICLLEKTGGISHQQYKKDRHHATLSSKHSDEGNNDADDRKLRAAVLVTSDSRSEAQDESGKIVIERLQTYDFDIVEYKVIPDDILTIESELNRFADDLAVDLVITSGGTGVGPRDVTPDATMKVIEKDVVGISEVLRAYGQRRTPTSMLSRAVAGIRKNTLIVNLPGSKKGVSESLEALFPNILHVFDILSSSGGKRDHNS